MKINKLEKGTAVVILDTSAFISGFNPNLYGSTVFTTNDVIDEVRNTFQKELINSAILHGTIAIESPSKESLENVSFLIRKLGEADRLSDTDKNIIALALDKKKEHNNVVVYTNDYSIMNVLKKLGIKYKTIGVSKIKNVLVWKKFCPSCKKIVSSYSKEYCPICGTKLKKISLKLSKY